LAAVTVVVETEITTVNGKKARLPRIGIDVGVVAI
jgi:hypothetical protein